MILKYLRPRDWGLMVFVFIFICLQVYLDLEIPGYMTSITTTISSGGTAEDVMNDGLKMLACAFGSLIASIVCGAIGAYIAAGISKTLRKAQFDKVEQFSMAEINRFSIASLVTRSTNDVTQVQFAIALGLQVIIKAPILAIWAISKISAKNMEWTVTTAVSVVLIIALIGIIMFFVIPKFKQIQWMNDDLNRVTKENLTGLRVVRAYNAEEYQENKFNEANDRITNTHIFITRMLAVMSPIMSTILSCLSLAIFWIGAIIINNSVGPGEIMTNYADMIVFTSYAMQVIMAFMMLIIVFMIIPRAMVAARRIEEVIDTEPSIKDGPFSGETETEGELVFSNVSFKYTDSSDYILKNVDFSVKKGETVAFIGSTGSGKTSLINLIPRFYDVSEGSITVDGVDVREYELTALRKKIGYVPQKAVMLNQTIEQNVRYGDSSEERTLEDVKKAVAIAQGTDFIEKSEEKYDRMISEGGTNLSGGQKQRVSIARAVCKRPEIYIFDDSFSALDYKTDRLLRSALKKETAGVTSLIVAQRIGTIRDADKIVVLNDGMVAGIGTHKELMETCEVYREIAYSQLSEEELQ